MKALTILYSACLCIAIAACKADSGTDQSREEVPAQTPGSPTVIGDNLSQALQSAPVAASAGALSSIDIESMRDLWDNCTSVDIIFYETRFSLSQTNQGSIRETIGFFGPTPVQQNPDCKPIGRVTFLVQGDIRQEADIYVGEGCNYFIWMKDNKPWHINPMSPQGATFFTNIITKGNQMLQGQ